jgi:UDP-N-acetylmuramoylalanine--D-glutamate ligase
VRELGGVRFYDDSKATNVHAAVIGLRALERRVVAVVGGVDKGLELDELVAALIDVARHVVLTGELGERLSRRLEGNVSYDTATSLDEAARLAARAAEPGDAVTLAPAASSFDWFSGFAERGRAWQAAVNDL